LREIKFRAWDERHKHLFQVQEMGYSEGKLWAVSSRNGYKHWNCYLMQYVGLKDKNGKEIYEGDILRVRINPKYCGNITMYNWHYINSELLYEVIWDDGMWKLRAPSRKTDFPFLFNTWTLELEVIGNVFENPELIERV